MTAFIVIQVAGLTILGAGLGAALGATQKCETGGCPLTANPWRGATYGAALGLLFGLTFAVGSRGAIGNVPEPESMRAIESVQDFNAQVLEAQGKTVAYFYADWCGACKQFKPTLNEVASERGGDTRFVKVNTDAQRQLALNHDIKYLPTTIVFENGRTIARLSGVASKDSLERALES